MEIKKLKTENEQLVNQALTLSNHSNDLYSQIEIKNKENCQLLQELEQLNYIQSDYQLLKEQYQVSVLKNIEEVRLIQTELEKATFENNQLEIKYEKLKKETDEKSKLLTLKNSLEDIKKTKVNFIHNIFNHIFYT